jgi:hypothetical protein
MPGSAISRALSRPKQQIFHWQIVTEVDLSRMARKPKAGEAGPVGLDAMRVAMGDIPVIFPNLRSCKFFMYVDVKFLFPMAAMMRATSMFSETSFDGVGSIIACPRSGKDLKMAVQCKETMESWAAPTDNTPPRTLHPLVVTAGSLYRASRGDPRGIRAKYARTMFGTTSSVLVPAEYGAIDYDSHEFWTVIDQGLNAFQRILGVQSSRAG